MKKYAFTLAEVLITLAIICVIAAITIPGIVANHRKRTLEAQFAKTYRNIMQAVNLAIAQHGDMLGWDWKDNYTNEDKDEFVKKYFLPNFNVQKFCPSSADNRGCVADINYKGLNPTNNNWGSIGKNTPTAILADGTIIIFTFSGNCKAPSSCFSFNADLNGAKKPNLLGWDGQPMISLYPQTGEVLPFGFNKDYNFEKGKFEKYTYEELIAECNREGGWATRCAARIVMENFKINY